MILMKITKQVFCEILNILVEDEVLNYDFDNNGSVCVYPANEDSSVVNYDFNEKKELIDPRIRRLQKQIEELESQKKSLESIINLLKNQ